MRCFARLRRGLLKERDTHTFTQTVMREALGDDWMSNFASFERVPFAAASIGQVHRAELKASVAGRSSLRQGRHSVHCLPFLSLPLPRACTRAHVLHGPETWDIHTEKLGVSQLDIRTSSLPLPSSQEQVSRFDKQRTHDPL